MKILETTRNLKENQFNHYTLNTGHNYVQDMDKVEETELQALCTIALIAPLLDTGKKVFFMELDGEKFFLQEAFDDDGYCLTIFMGENGEGPLVSSLGVWDEAKADAQWEMLTEAEKDAGIFMDPANTKARPQAPFICDVLYPQHRIWQLGQLLSGNFKGDWTSDFFKVFATFEFKGYYKDLNQAG